MNRYAIIGFGCAAYHCLKAIREHDEESIIDVYSDSINPPENPMLSTYYASGKLTREETYPFGTVEEIQKKYPFNALFGEQVTHIDSKTKTVYREDKSETYDKILLSTGASAVLPKTMDAGNRTFVMRSCTDGEAFRNFLDNNKVKSIAVIGASMTGIKVAEILKFQGIKCLMLDKAPHIFPQAAFKTTADKIEANLKHIEFYFDSDIKSVEVVENGLAVHTDSEALLVDAVVVCIGTRANCSIAPDIEVDRGFIVDRTMQTNAEGIYAAGDCAQGYDLQAECNRVIGLWANAAAQGRCAGLNICGIRDIFAGELPYNITHFLNMDFIGIGDPNSEGKNHLFINRDKGWQIEVKEKDGVLKAINILEKYEISGMIKNYMIKSILTGTRECSQFLKAMMERERFDRELIELLGGVEID